MKTLDLRRRTHRPVAGAPAAPGRNRCDPAGPESDPRDSSQRDGVVIVDGLTGERMTARVDAGRPTRSGGPIRLVVVAMQTASRLAVCPVLARNPHLKNILFLGNDVAGFHRYLDHLPEKKVLSGFPGAGGGWRGDDLVIMDREDPDRKSRRDLPRRDRRHQAAERPGGSAGSSSRRASRCSDESDIDGWLKYHFAFMAPTAGGDLREGRRSAGGGGRQRGDPPLLPGLPRGGRRAAQGRLSQAPAGDLQPLLLAAPVARAEGLRQALRITRRGDPIRAARPRRRIRSCSSWPTSSS